MLVLLFSTWSLRIKRVYWRHLVIVFLSGFGLERVVIETRTGIVYRELVQMYCNFDKLQYLERIVGIRILSMQFFDEFLVSAFLSSLAANTEEQFFSSLTHCICYSPVTFQIVLLDAIPLLANIIINCRSVPVLKQTIQCIASIFPYLFRKM